MSLKKSGGVKNSLAYNSELDALRQLLILRKYGGRISRTAGKIMDFPNGPYYFVEVTTQDGTTYVIEAYGEEAKELARETDVTEASRREEEELVIRR
jgi:hypothetical protein